MGQVDVIAELINVRKRELREEILKKSAKLTLKEIVSSFETQGLARPFAEGNIEFADGDEITFKLYPFDISSNPDTLHVRYKDFRVKAFGGSRTSSAYKRFSKEITRELVDYLNEPLPF